MVDLSCLEKHGLTAANLEKWLAIDPLNVPTGDINDPDKEVAAEARRGRMMNRHRSRTQEGMSRNFLNYKVFHALDKAWDTPLRQVTPTLIQEFIGQDPNQESVYKAFQDWGMTSLISEVPDTKTGKPVKTMNLPTFFNVFVPLVRSYVTIRWAKIMNDRRLTPFFKYEPVDQTTVMNLLCKALTDRVQVMSTQYGYYDVMKQAVLKMLHYSFCLLFPKSEWDYTDTRKYADEIDVLTGHKKENGEPASLNDEIKVTAREGMAYFPPHPSRTFYDLAHDPGTFNHGYGCEFAGYWRIARAREIQNGNYWNKDKIALGSADLISNNRLFFTSVYSACTLTIPIRPQPKSQDSAAAAAGFGLGAGQNDRERELANLYYGTEHGDQGVLLTEYWERLIPVDNGLGDYDCPVWFRFVLAGDGCTYLYAAPVPYDPILYFGYDADGSRTQNSSLSLEILPFQDHFSNMLTQILLTCKQNLANLTFIDEDQLMTGDPNQRQGARDTIDQIRNLGEGYYRFLNIFGYSSKKATRLQAGNRGVPDVVQSFNFPRGNVAEMSSVLRTILEILERVLVMSSQEIAQAASHELRVDEVRNIAQSTSSRLQFTAIPVDIAGEAWKRQLYEGLMQFGDEDFWVHLPSDIPLTQEQLSKMGFTVHKKEEINKKDRMVRYRVKKSALSALPIWALASTREGNDRIDQSKIAQSMALIMQAAAANPLTLNAIGADQFIEMLNQICKLMGLPRDFKLQNATPAGPSPEEQAAAQQQQQQEIKAMVDMVVKIVNGEMQKELMPLLDATKQLGQQMALAQQEIDALFKVNGLPGIHPANDTVHTEGNGSGAGAPNPRMVTPGPVLALPSAPA